MRAEIQKSRLGQVGTTLGVRCGVDVRGQEWCPVIGLLLLLLVFGHATFVANETPRRGQQNHWMTPAVGIGDHLGLDHGDGQYKKCGGLVKAREYQRRTKQHSIRQPQVPHKLDLQILFAQNEGIWSSQLQRHNWKNTPVRDRRDV
jgi:hypothetical protein